MNRQSIRTRTGKIIGYIETDSQGNKTVWDRKLNKICGYYKKASNMTITEIGRIVAYGDVSVLLLPNINEIKI